MAYLTAILIALLIPFSGALTKDIRPVTMFDSPEGDGNIRPVPNGGRYDPVVIDTVISGIRFIYGQDLGWTDQDQYGTWWHLFAHNDTYFRITTIIFSEEQTGTPGSWIQGYVFDGDNSVDLRYTSCKTVMVDGNLIPQVFYQYGSLNAITEYTCDTLGVGGGGWVLATPLNDPVSYPDDYCAYLPLTGACQGSGDFHLDAQGRGYSDDSHWYWKFDISGNRILGPTAIFPSPGWDDLPPELEPYTVFGAGYERGDLVTCPMGQIVCIQVPGYRIGDETPGWDDDRRNPLLPALRISRDYGETFSDVIWLDNETVPDLPGTNTGCDNASAGWGYGWQKQVATLIDNQGIIHLAATLMDPSNNTAADNFDHIGAVDYGLWHIWGVPAEDGYSWNATPITMGTGNVPPFPAGTTYGGISAITNPGLAITPDGRLICGYSDCSVINPDSSWYMDYFLIGSSDNGLTWGDYLNVTDDEWTDCNWFKLIPQTTADCVCVYGIPGTYSNDGPYWAYFVALDDIDFPPGSTFQLAGNLNNGYLDISWPSIPGSHEYWVYGAENQPHFTPGFAIPDYTHRIAILPAGTTHWSCNSGIGEPETNWTYLVAAVDESNGPIAISNRIGETDFEIDMR